MKVVKKVVKKGKKDWDYVIQFPKNLMGIELARATLDSLEDKLKRERYPGKIAGFKVRGKAKLSGSICYPIPLTKDEIQSDFDYPSKFVTIRWTRARGSGKRTHQVVVDWRKRKMWVDGELYFDGKRLRNECFVEK